MESTSLSMLNRDGTAPTAMVRRSHSEVALKKAHGFPLNPGRKVLANAAMNQLSSVYQRPLRSSSTTAVDKSVVRKKPVIDLDSLERGAKKSNFDYHDLWSSAKFSFVNGPPTPSQIPKNLLYQGQTEKISNFRSTTGFENFKKQTKMFTGSAGRPCNTFDVDDPFMENSPKNSNANAKHRRSLSSLKTMTAVKQPAQFLNSTDGFKKRRASRGSCEVALELNCPLDTTMDAHGLFDRHAKDGNLDYKSFGEIVVQIMKSTGQQLTLEEMEKKIEVSWREADRNFNGKVSFDEFVIWYSSWGFQKQMLLSPSKIRKGDFVKDFATKYGLDLGEIEAVHAKFQQFDEDGSGAIEFSEFVSLLHKLLKIPKGAELPANRLNHFWKEIDLDGSGSVCEDEFLQWYIKYFDVKGNSDVTPVEHFYKSVRPNFGRCM